jgi:hypothetical protein
MLPAYDAASRGCDATSWSGVISFRRVFSFLFLGGPFSASMKQKRVFFAATKQKRVFLLQRKIRILPESRHVSVCEAGGWKDSVPPRDS